MNISKTQILPLLVIIIISYLIGLLALPSLPDILVTHWGLHGEANGYSSRLFGTFFLPSIMFILLPLLSFLPQTDLYKQNISQFKNYYLNFLFIIYIFLFYLHVLVILYNLLPPFDLMRFLSPAFSLLMFYTSVLIQNAKRNFFIGIRTPWTLANDYVWDETHRLGAVLFRIVAIVSLMGIFLPKLAILFIMVPIVLVSLFLLVYSYIVYLGQKNNK